MSKQNRGADCFIDERTVLVELLGNHCSCAGYGCWHDGPCQVDDERCLQLDHINGGGTREIKNFGGNNRMVAYYLAHPDDAKVKLQVLCANCNWVKRDRNKEVSSRANRWLKRLLSPVNGDVNKTGK